ncbi:probable G-protein coupled receptor 139 [Pomacea canaliculata]|uniref:probable G-protein coupled receptor 139 n=1 Tax=Pomacea canaliculata TaxID=400727 RepID=UPI000D739CC8|nr:probable G-protein coupled receptor 139 [Pomacea canaliculata]
MNASLAKYNASSNLELYRTYMRMVEVADMIWIYVPPLILILGTFGNGMSIAILSKMNRRGESTVTTYLIALAVSDLLLLYFGLLRLWLYFEFGFDFMSVSSFVCKLCKWVVYMSGAMSAWFLVAVTLQRTVSVVWPHRMNAVCTPRTSRRLVAAIAMFLMAVHLHVLYGVEVVPLEEIGNNSSYWCHIENKNYLNFFSKVWSWVDLMIFSLTPFAILLVSNAILLKTVVMSARRALQTLTVRDTKQISEREKKASSMTVTLITISFTFFLLTGPFCIYLLIKPYILLNDISDLREKGIREVVLVSINMLWYSNSAINFYLYCLTGSRFRLEFKNIFTCRNHTK